jgi:hypothetical protein
MRIAIASLLLASVLAACSSKSSPPAAGSGTAVGSGAAVGSGSTVGSGAGSAATPGVGTGAPAAGPPRLALATGDAPIGATVSAPAGATATTSREELVATDGFTWAYPVATISGGGLPGTIEVSTGARLGWTPTTLAADRADVGRQGHAEVATEERPDGNWAAAYRLTDSCYLRSWSPSASLWCEARAQGLVGVPCDRVKDALAVCLSLAAEGKTAAPVVRAGARFPNLKDDAALAAVVAAGTAIAKDDAAALAAIAVPTGFRLGKRKVDAAGLTAAIAKAGTVSKLFGNDCTEGREVGARACVWNSEGDGADGQVAVLSTDGYGEVATFTVARQADGAWKLTGFTVTDLGEP